MNWENFAAGILYVSVCIGYCMSSPLIKRSSLYTLEYEKIYEILIYVKSNYITRQVFLFWPVVQCFYSGLIKSAAFSWTPSMHALVEALFKYPCLLGHYIFTPYLHMEGVFILHFGGLIRSCCNQLNPAAANGILPFFGRAPTSVWSPTEVTDFIRVFRLFALWRL